MNKTLEGKRVAVLATNGFEQSELFEPKKALEDAGAVVKIVSLESGEIKGWDKKDWGKSVQVDLTLDEANADDFNALHLPGGVMNPDLLRTEEKVLKFVKSFFDKGKPVAAICHAPWILINAEVVKGREMTSYHTVRKDLENAGAKWVDKEVVVDSGLVTSRDPDDLPAFNKKMIEEIGEGRHDGQKAAARSI
ncbi:MAG: type 1 glutamine amidotransferase [Pyrinomonadaceae bacterium]|nr:type 1 glutamine amidotransferase [Pyrinomonadaceae bacterium]